MRDLTNPPPLTPDDPSGPQAAPPGPVRFSLDGVPEIQRPALLREVFGRGVIRYDIEFLRDVPLHMDVTLRMLPRLMMMAGVSYGSHNQRTREMVSLDGSDDVGLVVGLKGEHLVKHSRGDLVLAGGDATLVSLDAVCSYMHRPPGDILALRVPRALISPMVTGVDDVMFRHIPQKTEALRLLTQYVTTAVNDEAANSPTMQHLVASHVHDLLAMVMGATRDAAETIQGRGVRAARLQAIKGDIARNLERADLSVAMLADRHNCTPRFLQRLFETEGTTFTEYVLAQRLARAHRHLSDPRRDGEKISAVAYDCGFGDVSYFNRVFRRHYGAAPSDIRAQAQNGAGSLNGAAE